MPSSSYARDNQEIAPGAGKSCFATGITGERISRPPPQAGWIRILYLKGISTGDFEEALAALVGKGAPGLSASTIARLKEVWTEEHARWQKRDLSAKRYVYCWADGIHLEPRLEE